MNKKYRIVTVLILLLSGFIQIQNLHAQELLKGNNLSQVKVETLKDSDILKLKNELIKSNISIEQAEAMALSKGMSAAEFAKLKLRLQSSSSSVNNGPANTGTTSAIGAEPSQNSETNTTVKTENANTAIFGSELFSNHSLTFEPNLKLATPLNYILGAGDELQIGIYGVQEYNTTIPVSVEGKITLQNVGQIHVGGMTFEAAVQNIKQAMGKAYSTLQSGESQIAVSLSKIRTIKVTIIGSNQPGNYSISSLATVFNALHLAGGPGENGSYRTIELIRNNKIERKIDIYRFLITGDQSDNVGLKDNDVIRIPTYTSRVRIDGEVKRAGIFELLPKETFNKLLLYASGFTENAYHFSVKLVQKTGKELKVKDVSEADFENYQPQSGDAFTVAKILDRYENRIIIKGAVFRPDTFALTPGLTVAGLILKAGGLKEDAYTNRATLIRLKEDLTREIFNINLKQAISLDKKNDLELKREDELMVYSIFDLKNEFSVTIDGEIRKPGKYPYMEKLSLNDLLVQAGGVSDAASKRVEIARMVKSDSLNKGKNNNIELINVEITPGNNEQAKNVLLQPYDIVSIRKMPVYYLPDLITISGSVQFPGQYALLNKKETIFDLINRAGGLTPEAAINGVTIKRKQEMDKIEAVENINVNLKQNDSTKVALKKINSKSITIPIEFEKIKKNKDSKYNIVLFPGDEIVVSRYDESVKVTGNVLLSSQIPYTNRGVPYYIASVGGTNSKGWKRKIYVVYPNGRAATTKNFLFFKFYPKVEAGSQIVVPTKPEKKNMSTGEAISIASVLTSLAGIVIAILRKP